MTGNPSAPIKLDTNDAQQVAAQIEESGINCILAGFPKCGTTSLAHWLSSSPLIAVSNPKETFLLCREHRQIGKVADEGKLSKCFSGAAVDHRIEASTLNVYSDYLINDVAERDNIKIILIFRDPLQAVTSWHNQVVQAEQAFSDDFTECWQHAVAAHQAEHGVVAAGNQATLPLMQDYVSVCMYGHWIGRWIDRLGADRVLVMTMEELSDSSADLSTRFNSFLGHDVQLEGTPPTLNRYANLRFESFYKQFKRSALNKTLRSIERSVPLFSQIRRTAKENFFRKQAAKPEEGRLESEIKQFFADDYAAALQYHRESVSREESR